MVEEISPLSRDVHLELQAAQMLLESGRPQVAVGALVDLMVRLADPAVVPTNETRRLAREVTSLWSTAQVLTFLSRVAPPETEEPPPDPWWDQADLLRTEVQVWVDHFRNNDEVGLRRWREQAAPYRTDILDVLRAEDVPGELWVVTILESGLNMRARNRSGAVGPWQFVPNTAQYLGLLITAHRDQRQDWTAATSAAARYLKELKEELGDGLLALAAFNCGPGRVRRDISRAKTRNFWDLQVPPETRAYVPRILALASILGTGDDDPLLHGSGMAYDHVRLPYPVRLADLARVAGADAETLRSLNPALLLDVTPADGHEVRVRVPEGTAQQVLAGLRDGNLPETQPPPPRRFHRIRSGDTLWDLARKYGTTVRTLERINGLRRGAVLRLGRKLEIPG